MAKQEETKQVLPQRQSVHVVFFSCQNCGEEADYIQFCPDCGKQMRVIDVVEKFGDEADEFIKKIEDKLAENGKPSIEETSIEDEGPNIIVLEDEDHIDAPEPVDDVDTLDEIFPDDDGDSDVNITKSDDDFSDLDDIVAELDKEDDDFSLDDLGDDGLPEL